MPYIAKGHPLGASGVAQCVELFEPAVSAVTIVEGAAAMVLSGVGALIPARDDVRLNAAVTER
ncbi:MULTISPECIES: hypothetical protein [Mycolicibacter]|uniref:hypothetical protein n=1 Tax=Mycolicibacter TaxID=1073531 RepID=UPI0007E98845|nr:MULTISPECIES: hypothetical protein [Mycobacteriaceae]OBG33352.1 hypothetical protein A5671_00415 [Mycolicibacter heraklionensis]OBJ30497.1 hypothetical protein A5631_14970 [Mycolicibacter heraklionensis]ULP46958.1 hypothetical protein MJO54_19585 [Mycolicibacter virginiensis]